MDSDSEQDLSSCHNSLPKGCQHGSRKCCRSLSTSFQPDDPTTDLRHQLITNQTKQQTQMQFVYKLQGKLATSKEKCNALEAQIHLLVVERNNSNLNLEAKNSELTTTKLQLENEQRRLVSTLEANTSLTQKVEQQMADYERLAEENSRLKRELVHLRKDWETSERRMREEMAKRLDQAASEHESMQEVAMREIDGFRREQQRLKAELSGQLVRMQANIDQAGKECSVSCNNFAANVHQANDSLNVKYLQEIENRKAVESKLQACQQSLETLRHQIENEEKRMKRETGEMIKNMEEIKLELKDKCNTISSLQNIHAGRKLGMGALNFCEVKDLACQALIQETQSMYQSLHEFAQTVQAEETYFNEMTASITSFTISTTELSHPLFSPFKPPSWENGPTDSRIANIRSAWNKRLCQITNLSHQLNCCQKRLDEVIKTSENSNQEALEMQASLQQLHADFLCLREETEAEKLDLRRTLELEADERHRLLAEERTSLSDRLGSTLSERDALIKQMADIRLDHERRTRETERDRQCIEELERRLAETKEAVDRLRQDRQTESNEETDILKTNLTETCQQLGEIEMKLNERDEELTELLNQVKSEKVKRREFAEKCSELSEQVKSLQSAYLTALDDLKSMDHAKNSLIEEVMKLQSEIAEIESENEVTLRALEHKEQSRLVLEDDLNEAMRTRVSMTEQVNFLTHQKDTLQQESGHQEREICRLRESLARVTKDLGTTTKDKSDLQIQINKADQKGRQLGQELTFALDERNAMERELRDLKREMNVQKQTLETAERSLSEKNCKVDELSDSLNRTASSFAAVEMQLEENKRKLALQLDECEQEHTLALHALRESGENRNAKLNQQLIETRQELERRLSEVTESHTGEMDRQRERQCRLQADLVRAQAERGELVASAEADKQTLVRQLEEEKEKHERHERGLNESLQMLEEELKRLHSAASMTADQQVRAQLEETQIELEQDRKKNADVLDKIRSEHIELQSQKFNLEIMVGELKEKVSEMEHRLVEHQREMDIVNECSKHVVEEKRLLGQDLVATRKQFCEHQTAYADTTRQFEQLQSRLKEEHETNLQLMRSSQESEKRINEYKKDVKCVDGECQQLKNLLQSCDKKRASSKKEAGELRHKVKHFGVKVLKYRQVAIDLEAQLKIMKTREIKQQQELCSTKARLSEFASESSALKAVLSKTERSLLDIQNSMTEKEREWRFRVQEVTAVQTQAIQIRGQLEIALESATARQAVLQSSLEEAEAREAEVRERAETAETRKHELELKLQSVHSSLRRIVGYQQETISTQRRFGSAHRKQYATNEKLESGSTSGFSDLDVEAVRMGLRDLAMRLNAAERGKEEAEMRAIALESRLADHVGQISDWTQKLFASRYNWPEKGINHVSKPASYPILLKTQAKCKESSHAQKTLAKLESQFAAANSGNNLIPNSSLTAISAHRRQPPVGKSKPFS